MVKSPLPQNETRVMVVDDSHLVRTLFQRRLKDESDIVISGTASHGISALRQMAQNSCDVILLDMDMPHMDGLTAIPHMLNVDPAIQILIISSKTKQSSDIALRALSAGAADYILKPNSFGEDQPDIVGFHASLLEKIRYFGLLAHQKRRHLMTLCTNLKDEEDITVTLHKNKIDHMNIIPSVIAVAASTGGPLALGQFLEALPQNITQPVVINQHLPGEFTTILVRHLSEQTGRAIQIAQSGMVLQPNNVYVAPGNHHLLFHDNGDHCIIDISTLPPYRFSRPSATLMIRSLAQIYGSRALAVILTGMGSDGLDGCIDLFHAGGTIIAQDRASAVVWGMPGVVAQAGICSIIDSPQNLARYVTTRVAERVV